MYSSQELTSELKEIHIRRSAEGDPQKYEYMYRRECQNVSLAERTVIHSVVCTEGVSHFASVSFFAKLCKIQGKFSKTLN